MQDHKGEKQRKKSQVFTPRQTPNCDQVGHRLWPSRARIVTKSGTLLVTNFDFNFGFICCLKRSIRNSILCLIFWNIIDMWHYAWVSCAHPWRVWYLAQKNLALRSWFVPDRSCFPHHINDNTLGRILHFRPHWVTIFAGLGQTFAQCWKHDKQSDNLVFTGL